MGVLDPYQIEEAIAVRTAPVIPLKIYTDRLRTTLDDLTGKTVQVRIAAGSSVEAKVYDAVNRANQTTTGKGLCDITLEAGFHTEEADFTAQTYKKTDAVGNYVLQWPEYKMTFVPQITAPTPTPTPTATPTPTPTPTPT